MSPLPVPRPDVVGRAGDRDLSAMVADAEFPGQSAFAASAPSPVAFRLPGARAREPGAAIAFSVPWTARLPWATGAGDTGVVTPEGAATAPDQVRWSSHVRWWRRRPQPAFAARHSAFTTPSPIEVIGTPTWLAPGRSRPAYSSAVRLSAAGRGGKAPGRRSQGDDTDDGAHRFMSGRGGMDEPHGTGAHARDADRGMARGSHGPSSPASMSPSRRLPLSQSRAKHSSAWGARPTPWATPGLWTPSTPAGGSPWSASSAAPGRRLDATAAVLPPELERAAHLLRRLQRLTFYSTLLEDEWIAALIHLLQALVAEASAFAYTAAVERDAVSASADVQNGRPQGRGEALSDTASSPAASRRPSRKQITSDAPPVDSLAESVTDEWPCWAAEFTAYYEARIEAQYHHGTDWEDYVLDAVLYADNTFTRIAQQYAQVPERRVVQKGRSRPSTRETALPSPASPVAQTEEASAAARHPHLDASMLALCRRDLNVLQELCAWTPERVSRCIVREAMHMSDADALRIGRAIEAEAETGAEVYEDLAPQELAAVLLYARKLPATSENGSSPSPTATTTDASADAVDVSRTRHRRPGRVEYALTAGDDDETHLREEMRTAARCLATATPPPSSRRPAWSCLLNVIAQRYRLRGVGPVGRYYMLYYSGAAGAFTPVECPDPVTLDDLVGYEIQKQAFVQNVRALIAGLPAHHVLLTGPGGTGKSALVKAAANEFYASGLRLVQLDDGFLGVTGGHSGLSASPVEMAPDGKASEASASPGGSGGLLHDLRMLVREAAARPSLRFVLLVDDMNYDEEDPIFTAVKGVLDGGALRFPPNVILVVTGNIEPPHRQHTFQYFYDKHNTEDGQTPAGSDPAERPQRRRRRSLLEGDGGAGDEGDAQPYEAFLVRGAFGGEEEEDDDDEEEDDDDEDDEEGEWILGKRDDDDDDEEDEDEESSPTVFDTDQDHGSFFDRFGLIIPFKQPTREQYLEFVRHAVERRGNVAQYLPPDILEMRALAWANDRESMCARTAYHFVRRLEAERVLLGQRGGKMPLTATEPPRRAEGKPPRNPKGPDEKKSHSEGESNAKDDNAEQPPDADDADPDAPAS